MYIWIYDIFADVIWSVIIKYNIKLITILSLIIDVGLLF